MRTEVRPATQGDVPALEALELEARGAAVDVRGGPRLLADHPTVGGEWGAWVDDPARRLWVATIDGVPMGYLALRMPIVAGGSGTVTQVFVTPGAREVGLGDELLATAIAELERHGAGAVDAFALPGDRLTKNLYERAGIVARLIVVSRPLGG